MDYKATLNMPKSGFPMRAGLPKREPEMLKHWEEMDLYNVMLKKNEGKPRFALHDGPPFSNGGLHMGHALNKSLKDFITRSYAMRGYYTPYIPGWDNHGMPIESAIIKQNKLNHKAMPVSDVGERRAVVQGPPATTLPKSTSASRWKASSASACWATGSIPTRPWTPALRLRRSRSSARCTRRATSTRA